MATFHMLVQRSDLSRKILIMIHDIVAQLGARLLGEKAADLDSALKSVERMLPASDRYREMLMAFGGAVVFDKGAKFTSDVRSPLNHKDGRQSLEVLYGLGSGKHSIEYQAARYENELPTSFVPIGEAPGGNLICVDNGGIVYLWDHESHPDEGLWRVSSSLDAFIGRLEPDDSGIGSTKDIVESESFLDF